MKDELEVIMKSGEPGIAKFIVRGRINATNASTLDQKLETSINDGATHILMNMSQVDYLSSSGIRIILKIYKQLNELGGKFNIEFPSEHVKNVLGLVALDKMLIK